jgi:hypothetical protein
MSLQLSGTSGVLDNSGAFIAGTAIASTSGTSIDFTSIPSWVKRVTVNLTGVSTNGTSSILIQTGAGSVTTTGYLTSSSIIASTVATINNTNGFQLYFAGNDTSAAIRNGSLIINLIGSNTWAAQGIFATSNATSITTVAGSIPLSGTLDRIRITTVNGTDTFDAGSINILYE